MAYTEEKVFCKADWGIDRNSTIILEEDTAGLVDGMVKESAMGTLLAGESLASVGIWGARHPPDEFRRDSLAWLHVLMFEIIGTVEYAVPIR